MIPKYEVLYELNGRKMKTTVEARSEKQAVAIIQQRLIIYSAQRVEDDQLTKLRNMFHI